MNVLLHTLHFHLFCFSLCAIVCFSNLSLLFVLWPQIVQEYSCNLCLLLICFTHSFMSSNISSHALSVHLYFLLFRFVIVMVFTTNESFLPFPIFFFSVLFLVAYLISTLFVSSSVSESHVSLFLLLPV